MQRLHFHAASSCAAVKIETQTSVLMLRCLRLRRPPSLPSTDGYYSNTHTHTQHLTRDIKIRRGQAAQGNIVLRCQRSQATELFMAYLLIKTPLCSYSPSEWFPRCRAKGGKCKQLCIKLSNASSSAWYILLYIFCLVTWYGFTYYIFKLMFLWGLWVVTLRALPTLCFKQQKRPMKFPPGIQNLCLLLSPLQF